MRLVDAVFRQGHLSEQALVEAVMTGERPAHLDRCDLCADRAVELGRWLDDVRGLGLEAADEVFTSERLAAQHAQILRKLEQADEPSRVIAFPKPTRSDAREASTRKVAPAWVGIAAAAGLALGVIGGQVSARMTMEPMTVTRIVEVTPGDALEQGPSAVPANFHMIGDDDLDGTPAALRTLDEMTPLLIARGTSYTGRR